MFIQVLLFLYFFNLYNSFTLTNYYIHKLHSKITMGCDYYIDKNLYIYYNDDKLFSYINLEHEKGYYYFFPVLDEDEDGYEEEREKEIIRYLETQMQPIVIYSNNSFCKSSFENKYKKMIEREIQKYGKTMDAVKEIIKMEERYER